jgi:protein-disulfide isomerase/uncharacterized membrane protein
MNEQKSLTLNGLVLKNFIFILISIGMIFVGVYLTNHFFDTMYPSGISTGSSFCDINQFWGCDKATKSSFGVILGTPTSVFGIILGIFGLLVGFIGKPKLEKTAKTVFLINLIICLILLVFSLATLGSLCPMCTVYYLLSAAAYFMLHKFSDASFALDPKYTGSLIALTVIPMIGFNSYIGGIETEKTTLSQSYIEQFSSLKEYGDPTIESPYKVHMATDKFSDAPIRITVFSDFQCPYCKSVADQLPELIAEFGDKINIQYMFYPLDANCNTKMKGGMHPYACTAAYFAACDESKFVEVHDYIFENQSEIGLENLKKWAAKFGLDNSCLENKKVQDAIQQTLSAGDQFALKSTPTIIINGKKLEGMVPTIYMKAILGSLVK